MRTKGYNHRLNRQFLILFLNGSAVSTFDIKHFFCLRFNVTTGDFRNAVKRFHQILFDLVVRFLEYPLL